MRVLLITDWNRGRGGAEAYALTLRDELRAAGDDVRLLTSSAGDAADGAAEYVAYGTELPAAQALLQIANPLAAVTVRRAVRELRPDVALVNMFAHHLSPAAVSALGDTPAVLLVSDYKIICPIGSKLRPDGSICRTPAGWVCRRAGCVGLLHWLRDQPRYAAIRSATGRFRRLLACSRWVQAELAAAGFEAEAIYLPAPAPPQSFRREPAEEPTFLYFGRLDVEKGVDVLLRAFARLLAEQPAARLQLAGRGPERARLEALSEQLGVRDAVDFLGWMTPAELDEPLSRAWASVAPSVWAEPLGLVAVESVLRGLPVVVSSVGGLAELVEDGVNGLKFPTRDEAALADCLRRIADGSAFPGRSLNEDVVERYRERFGMDRHIERMRRIFAEVAERG